MITSDLSLSCSNLVRLFERNKSYCCCRAFDCPLKFMRKLGIPFGGHRDSVRLESLSDMKGIDTSAGIF